MNIMILLVMLVIPVILIGICCAWGFATRAIGKSKGKDNCFWWGFFLGLIGLVIVLCITSKSATSSNNIDNYEALEKLQKLKESGAITEEEFEESKKKILDKI